MVHDGNVYFEHCYGADFNPKVSPEKREACWMAWLADYTRHQAAHRVDYAMRRVEAIQAGAQTLMLSGFPGGQDSAPSDAKTAARFAQPRRARLGTEVATTAQLDGEDAATPGHGCEAVCGQLQSDCNQQCPADLPDCMPLCKRDAAICRRGCY